MHRCFFFLLCLGIVLAAVETSARADAESGSSPLLLRSDSREARLAGWALTYAPKQPSLRSSVEALLRETGPEAEQKLFLLGEPARRVLLELAATDPVLAVRTSALRRKMQDLADEVERRDLYCDLRYLTALGDVAADRVARIVPPDAPTKGAVAWCMERAGSLRYEPASDRYVVLPIWGRHQSPRRWRHRDTVHIEKSARLISASSPFTAEFWVRWPTNGYQSLLGDESWPGMSAKVAVERENGFTIRRRNHGSGTAVLEFTCATTERTWWSVTSAPLHVTSQWEHIAVSSDGAVVRLFRDGALVAARSTKNTSFVRGVRDLSLGVVPDGWKDRRAHFDLRALRISEGSRYTDEFVPPTDFGHDSATILLLDFTPDTTILADQSGGGRVARGQGHWIPAHDPSALGTDLQSVGAEPAAMIVAEAERGGRTDQWYVADRSQFSEGVCLEIWSDQDPGSEGHTASIPFRVPRAGTWRIHLIGAGLHRGSAGVSPFAWSVDGGASTTVFGPRPSLYGLLGRSNLDLSSLGTARLTEGEHVLHVQLLARRRQPDRRWSLWIDAVALQEVTSVATDAK